MEEDTLEEEIMDKESSPRRGLDDVDEDKKFMHYFRLRVPEVNPVALLMKSNTFLVAPPIPEHMPLQMDIIPNVAKLKFEDFDTQ